MGKLKLAAAMVIVFGFSIVFLNCSSFKNGKEERKIEISEVPEAVMNTASNAVKGINLIFAEFINEEGIVVYKLKGNLDDKVYEFKILQNGTLLKVQLKNHVEKIEIKEMNSAAKGTERKVAK